MDKVKAIKSYHNSNQNKVVSNELDIKLRIIDWETFKQQRILDINQYAEMFKGKASYKDNGNTLYLSYLDIPNTDKIDTLYILET